MIATTLSIQDYSGLRFMAEVLQTDVATLGGELLQQSSHLVPERDVSRWAFPQSPATVTVCVHGDKRTQANVEKWAKARQLPVKAYTRMVLRWHVDDYTEQFV